MSTTEILVTAAVAGFLIGAWEGWAELARPELVSLSPAAALERALGREVVA